MLGFVGFNQTLNARTSLQIKLQWINIQLWFNLNSDFLFSFPQVPSSYRDAGRGKKASCECILFRNIPEWSLPRYLNLLSWKFQACILVKVGTKIINFSPLYQVKSCLASNLLALGNQVGNLSYLHTIFSLDTLAHL